MPQDTERQETQKGRPEQALDKQALAQLIQKITGKEFSPEEAEQAQQLISSLFGSGIKEQLTPIFSAQRGRRGEAQSYPVAKGEWGKELMQGVDKLPQFRDPQLQRNFQDFLDKVRDFEQKKLIGPFVLGEWGEGLNNLYEQAREKNDPGMAAIDKAIQNLDDLQKTRQFQSDELGNIYFQLLGDEIREMGKSLEGAEAVLERWISHIEDSNVYAHETVNENFFRKFQAAIGWLPSLEYPYVEVSGKEETGEKLDEEKKKAIIKTRKKELIDRYRFRIENHNMRIAMEHFEWREIMPQSQHMGSACILETFRTKNASVAFNLYQRYYERYRLVYGSPKIDDKVIGEAGVAKWRITPEAEYEIHKQVREELEKNFNFYGFETAKEAVTASRIGFNLFDASMRKAVHVARGQIKRVDMKQIEGYRMPELEPSFQSDPDEILANLYNPRQFKIDKWTNFGDPQRVLFEHMLNSLGNGDMDVGDQEFVNILQIVDYFSSGWRIKNLPGAMKARMIKAGIPESQTDAIIDSLATGLWLQMDSPTVARTSEKEPNKIDKKLGEAERRLRAVARFRPLELLKAYAVSVDPEGKKYSTGEKHDQFQNMLKNGDFNVGNIPIDNYVRLEEILGRYIYPIYDQNMLVIDQKTGKPTKDWKEYWSRIHGINIGNPAQPADAELIRKVVQEVNEQDPEKEQLTPEQIQGLYRKLQTFLLDSKTIADLRDNPHNSHLYHKTLYLDDAPLGMLEEEIDGIPKLSQKLFGTEGGRRDPYARIWGDTEAASRVVDGLFTAMKARDPETLVAAMKELAEPMVGYGGRVAFQKLAFNIATGWLELTKPDAVWGLLGLAGKVPWATSEGERLFGLSFPALDPKERRAAYEKIKSIYGNLFAEAGGKDLDKKIKKKLGIKDYQVAFYAARLIALLLLVTMLQETFKQMEEDEK